MKLLPEGSLIETLTATFFVPTVGIVICSDLPTFVETAAVEFFKDNFVRFLVEVVVTKKVLLAAVGDGVGVGVTDGVADGVGVAVGVGVAIGVGVAVGVGVGVAAGVGVGVVVGAGVTASLFAPGSEIA